MHCPHCDKEIDRGLLSCPFCGGEINSPVEDCLERAITLIDEERRDEATEFLKEVLNRYPNNASAHSLLASLYEEAKDYPSAIYHYRRAVEIDPESEAEKRKLELLTGEKFTPSRLPLLPPALALLGVLFIVLIITSLPRKREIPSSLNNQLMTNQWQYPPYNQFEMPYSYYPNLPQSENVLAQPNIPQTVNLPAQLTTPRPSASPTRKSPNSTAPPPPQEQITNQPYNPPVNIIIQPTSPPPTNLPSERKSKIIVSVKKVPPSFEGLFSQGIRKMNEKAFDESEKLLRQALALAPADRKGEVHLYLALSLKELGKLEEAKAEFETAENLLSSRNDPYSRQLLELAKEGRRFCEERL
ncbi:tetratricopeptide repeat protein [bacterium]|nr:tetratricopeptide repeat protein [bacterium]